MRRRFEVPPSSNFCTLHLVDDGVEVEAITGNVTIDFDGVGPVEGFQCSLDKAQYSPCKKKSRYIEHDVWATMYVHVSNLHPQIADMNATCIEMSFI